VYTFSVWSDYGNGWRIFFRHGLRIPTSTNAFIVTVAKEKGSCLFQRDIKKRKEKKRRKERNGRDVIPVEFPVTR
jgi:hypothetical protein